VKRVPSGGFRRTRFFVPGFDGLDGVFKSLFQSALADGAERESEDPSLEVLALAYNDVVDIGGTVGIPRERVGMARGACLRVGVGGPRDDAIRIRPVVVEALPDAL